MHAQKNDQTNRRTRVESDTAAMRKRPVFWGIPGPSYYACGIGVERCVPILGCSPVFPGYAETVNLAREQPSVLEELRAKTQKFRRDTDDGWLIVDQQRGYKG